MPKNKKIKKLEKKKALLKDFYLHLAKKNRKTFNSHSIAEDEVYEYLGIPRM